MITRRSALLAGLSLTPTVLGARRAVAFSRQAELSGCVRLSDGRKLGYAEYGDPNGRLVLYFHGTPGSRVEARLISEETEAAGVRLLAVERPGIGLSDYQMGRRVLDCPPDIEYFVAALGYEGTSFGIVGMSGGAPYALACIKCIPHRLTHVALVSGHTPMNAPGVQRGNQDKLIAFICRRPRLGEIGIRAAIRMLHRNPNRFVQRASEKWSAADRQLILGNPEYRTFFLRTVREAVRSGPAGLMRAIQLLGVNWGFRLRDLPPASVSIWQGGCDPIVPPSMGHYFHQQIAGSELIIDPRAGHLTMPKWHAAEILARFP